MKGKGTFVPYLKYNTALVDCQLRTKKQFRHDKNE